MAFRRLPAKLQIVVTLALIEEQPYAEIAEALDVPIGTVKSRVFRATRALREELARPGHSRMTDETRILALLRSAVPPVATETPSRDMWPRIVTRSADSQKWSWLDVGLGVGVTIALVMRPDLLMLLAYHF